LWFSRERYAGLWFVTGAALVYILRVRQRQLKFVVRRRNPELDGRIHGNDRRRHVVWLQHFRTIQLRFQFRLRRPGNYRYNPPSTR
jgi:hypothetical protein